MKNEATAVLSALVIVLGAIIVGALIAVFGAFVLQDLWGWFIVPLGVSEIGLAHAYGIAVIASLLTMRNYKENEKVNGIVFAIMGISISWGLGYIAHLFM